MPPTTIYIYKMRALANTYYPEVFSIIRASLRNSMHEIVGSFELVDLKSAWAESTEFAVGATNPACFKSRT